MDKQTSRSDLWHDPVTFWDMGVGGGGLAKAGKDVVGLLTSAKAAEDTITLYRAVSKGEYDDIMSSGIFRPKPDGSSMDGKWFSETLEGAGEWGKQMFDEFTVVAANVSRSVADEMFQVEKLDGIANARFAIDDILTKVNYTIQKIWPVP
jgi:hypothetical protein